ncbi:MAG: hypothetical protein ABI680_10705, partial [Chthoniobacteraceae bacterium]
MPSSAKIIELRQLIQRHLTAPPVRQVAPLGTSVPPLDAALEGGLLRGGIVELVCPRPSSGGTLLMHAILRGLAGQGCWSALIDGRDSFDPQTAGPGVLAHLLWVRCHTVAEAIRAADLLLRDGNLPLILLDLHDHSARELHQTPSSTWYRFQRVLEPSSTALLVLTPRATVPCAGVRLELQKTFSLPALEREAGELLGDLHLRSNKFERPTLNVQHPTPNGVPEHAPASLDVGRWKLDVGRF